MPAFNLIRIKPPKICASVNRPESEHLPHCEPAESNTPNNPFRLPFHNEDWLKEEEKAAWHQFLAGVKTDLESVLLSLETKKKKESTRFKQIDAMKSVWFYEHKHNLPFSSMSARHFDGCSTVKKKVSIA